MTEREALMIIKSFPPNFYNIAERLALEKAVEALQELELYKQSGLCLVPADIYEKQCKELDELKEKNTAKKPVDKSKNPTDWHIMACPNCERTFWNSGQFVRYQPKFCNYCGQSIDWTDWGGSPKEEV